MVLHFRSESSNYILLIFRKDVLFNCRRKFAHNEVADGYLPSTPVRCDVAQTAAANADCDVFQRLHSCSFSSAD